MESSGKGPGLTFVPKLRKWSWRRPRRTQPARQCSNCYLREGRDQGRVHTRGCASRKRTTEVHTIRTEQTNHRPLLSRARVLEREHTSKDEPESSWKKSYQSLCVLQVTKPRGCDPTAACYASAGEGLTRWAIRHESNFSSLLKQNRLLLTLNSLESVVRWKFVTSRKIAATHLLWNWSFKYRRDFAPFCH